MLSSTLLLRNESTVFHMQDTRFDLLMKAVAVGRLAVLVGGAGMVLERLGFRADVIGVGGLIALVWVAVGIVLFANLAVPTSRALGRALERWIETWFR